MNLTMMDFPVGRVQAVLDKSIERIPIADLTKVRTVLSLASGHVGGVVPDCEAPSCIFLASMPGVPALEILG